MKSVRTAVVGLTVALLTVGGATAARAGDSPAATVAIDSGGAGGAGFLADSFVTGGIDSVNRSGSLGNPNFGRTVAHPIPQEQWDTYRFTDASYRIPGLTPGAAYQVRLYFVEWYWSKVGQRVFDVAVNGDVVLKDFDPIKAAVDAGGDGRFLGVERDVPVTAGADGTVSVDLIRGTADQPEINAIVLAPAA